MGNLFSGGRRGGGGGAHKEKLKITPRDRAILDLKIQRDRLKQYQKRLTVVIERETEIAKLHLANGNRELALLTLKKKKYQQSLLESSSNQLFSLEQQTMAIEFAIVEQQVFEGLKKGNVVLEQIQEEMSLEEVEKLMSDTAEAIAYQNEISAMLAGKLTEEDEEDLERELEELTEEIPQLNLPEVPTVAPVIEISPETDLINDTESNVSEAEPTLEAA